MHNAKIAEWLLSSVMAPALARTVVGDLLEGRATRNAGWFWVNVFQTMVGCGWRDLKEHPGVILRLAVRGALVQSTIAMTVALFFKFTGSIFSGLGLVPGHSSWFILSLVLVFLAPLFAGRWIGRRSSGKELAVCVVMTVVSPFVLAAINAIVICCVWPAINSHNTAPLWLYWWEIWFFIPYLLGALHARQRRVPI
ncbi:MAG TPA: hypothetical protein VGM64_06535 [Lacunisphaera sp.]|jgi:hypothetical protein